jgi:hypothetical protein
MVLELPESDIRKLSAILVTAITIFVLMAVQLYTMVLKKLG